MAKVLVGYLYKAENILKSKCYDLSLTSSCPVIGDGITGSETVS